MVTCLRLVATVHHRIPIIPWPRSSNNRHREETSSLVLISNPICCTGSTAHLARSISSISTSIRAMVELAATWHTLTVVVVVGALGCRRTKAVERHHHLRDTATRRSIPCAALLEHHHRQRRQTNHHYNRGDGRHAGGIRQHPIRCRCQSTNDNCSNI